MTEVKVEEIERLLDDERAALLAGDFAALQGVAERKEVLARELAASRPDGSRLGALRAKAERNAELLTAAGKGIRSVTRRIAEVRRANGPLKTYGQDGTQQTLGTGAGSFEKRA